MSDSEGRHQEQTGWIGDVAAATSMLRMLPCRSLSFAYLEWQVPAGTIPAGTMMDSLLTNLAEELLVQDITEPSAIPGSLSDQHLQHFYDAVLEQFALELLTGAHENSEWSDGKLVIAGNRGRINLLKAAFYAVQLEVQRRGVVGC